MRGRSLRFSHHCCGVMAANVEETAKYIVIAADDDDRLAGDVGGDVLTGLAYLIDTADHLPGMSEDSLQFEIVETLIVYHDEGIVERLIERSAWVVAIDDLLQEKVHAQQIRRLSAEVSPYLTLIRDA